MIEFLLQVAQETWFVVKEAAIFLLFGFLVAGVLAVLMPLKTLLRFFGTGKIKSVLWASALGMPLPLCSCGVLPTALGLRRQGATPGATVSFLIATPETGIDSISLSYALLDPLMTVFRPLSAMATAIAAGIATNFWGDRQTTTTESAVEQDDSHPDTALPEPQTVTPHHTHDHASHLQTADSDDTVTPGTPIGSYATTRKICTYAFRDLLDDTSHWLVLGIVLSGLVAVLLPATIIERYLGDGFTTMVAMLILGIPIYTCASSSTPIAAALVLKGLNPGAALVFLLSGPATNLGSFPILLKFLGRKIVAIYLGAIVVMTLLAGYTLNWLYQAWDIEPQATFGRAGGVPEPVKVAAAVILIALLFLSMRRTHVPEEWLRMRDSLTAHTGVHLTAVRLQGATALALALLYLSSGIFAVPPGAVGIKSRFGQIVAGELSPGFQYRLPWPIASHQIVHKDLIRRIELGFRSTDPQNGTVRAQARRRLTVGGPGNPVPMAIASTGFWFQKEKIDDEAFVLTGDANIVDLSVAVQYRINNAIAYAYNVSAPDALVRSVILSVLRETVGTISIDEVLTTARGAMERQSLARVQDLLDTYQAGMQVVSLSFLNVHAPEDVHQAFRDVASAQEDKMHIINRALTFAGEKVNLAVGEAAAMIEEALAFREEKILRAEGDATAYGLRENAYQDAPDLTRFRLRLETAEEVLAPVQKFLRPVRQDVNELDLWLLEPNGMKQNR